MERKGWKLRNKWNIPPTDPRWLDMTKELIELEFAHMVLDHKGTESFEDADFEEYAEDAADSKVRVPAKRSEEQGASKEDENPQPDWGEAWEDVEEAD